jgi:diphthamide synthase (EF-2-diphthine--ammonia ligase)
MSNELSAYWEIKSLNLLLASNANNQLYKVVTMEGNIHTLQEYMLHTETITYIIIVAALIGITFFYRFLTDRDDDEE